MKTPTEESYSPFQEAYAFFNERLFDGELPVCLITFQRQKRIMGYVSLERWVNNRNEYIHELAINPEYFANYPIIEICQTLCHEMVHIWQAQFGSPGRRGYHNLEWAHKMIAVGLMPSTTGAPGGEIIGESVSDYILPDGPFVQAFEALASQGFQLTWIDRYPVIRPVKPSPTIVIPPESDADVQDDPKLSVAQLSALRSPVAELALPYSFEELDAAFTASMACQRLPASHAIHTTKPYAHSNKHKYRCPQCHLQLWGKPELYVICGECNAALVESE